VGRRPRARRYVFWIPLLGRSPHPPIASQWAPPSPAAAGEGIQELVDLEDFVRQWRFRHVTTVERIIGGKKGTGGTEGVAYLRGLLEIRLFPELWDLRTAL
jgi:tryptophan 2,3-dioxygenase